MITSPCVKTDEYVALRATVRERGTARMVLVPFVFLGWAAAAIATAGIITVALSTIIPLLVLAAGFEAVFALHVNVERIGRYLQVFHEAEAPAWEHVAMEFGRQFPGTGPDPLFSRLFLFGCSVNFIPAALGGETWELLAVGIPHLLAMYRIRMARDFAGRQRAEDLKRFEALAEARRESLRS